MLNQGLNLIDIEKILKKGFTEILPFSASLPNSQVVMNKQLFVNSKHLQREHVKTYILS